MSPPPPLFLKVGDIISNVPPPPHFFWVGWILKEISPVLSYFGYDLTADDLFFLFFFLACQRFLMYDGHPYYAPRTIGCIWRIKTFLTSKNLISLYYAMILPHIDYCCTSWGINSNTNLVRLQRQPYIISILDWYLG